MEKLKDQTKANNILKKDKYHKPNITINKVYTKTGDKGKTNIIGGHEVLKSNIRIKSFGEIDELNASIAISISQINNFSPKFKNSLKEELQKIQHQLFNLGNMVATIPKDIKVSSPSICEDDIEFLEKNIDKYNSVLPILKSFVLPGGSMINSTLHLSRTICRRCERTVVELSENEQCDENIIKYLNRLSDYLFVLSRYVIHLQKIDEFLWDPNYNE